jgi:hypothetical protein
LGAAGFLAGAGRGFGTACAVVEGSAGCDGGAAPAGGSGVMMLTGGMDADVGNSAVVGLPVGSDASAPVGGMPDSTAFAVAAGALHDEA